MLSHMSVEIQGVEMLTPVVGFCCDGFINPIGVVAGVRRQRLALSIGPNEDGDRIQSLKHCVLNILNNSTSTTKLVLKIILVTL
jgi:hypothetical protein